MWRNWNPCAVFVGCEMLLGKTVWRFFKKLKTELSSDLAILLLSVNPKELKAGTGIDTCTPMSIAASFTTAKRWEQPKYP